MKNIGFHTLLLFALLLVVTSCQQAGTGSKTYTAGQIQTAMTVYSGTVLRVSEVQIQYDSQGIGAVIGGIAGGVAGSTMGGGSGRKLTTTGGALAGLAAGAAAEKALSTKPAWEIEVELDNGRIIVVVQEQDDVFAVGDRVRIIDDSKGNIRVRQ